MKVFNVVKRKVGKLIHLKFGRNSIRNNLWVWSDFDWKEQGDEWSNDPEWKQSLVDHVLNRNVPEDSHVLEIAPGAGRWTEYLVKRARHLTLVDLTPKCIEMCRRRFKDHTNIDYVVNDGRDLGFIPSDSIDSIWSYDAFVHISAKDIRSYVSQFPRILKSGGNAVIHHARLGNTRFGWRSDMSAEKMKDYANEFGLEIVSQFENWGDGRFRLWPDIPEEENPDTISLLRKS